MPKKVCVVKGDGVCPEVVLPTVQILEGMSLDIEFLDTETGDESQAKYGELFPLSAKQTIDEADCTLFGSTTSIAGVHGYLRWGKRCFANLRPTKYKPGLSTPLKNPEDIDFVIVRENIEGLYPGWEGDIAQLAPMNLTNSMLGTALDTTIKGKFAVKTTSEEITRDLCEIACQWAMKRKSKGGKGKVTVSSKYNVLIQADELFRRIAEETVNQYPELTFDQLLIDNCGQQLVKNPQQFDVLVMCNQHGDILGDVAGALVGGLGIAPGAIIGKEYAYFGPVHGTAPKYIGMNIMNPTATLLSACLMLEYLEFEKEAQQLEEAVYQVYKEGKHLTRDQGGMSSTSEFCNAVRANLL